MLCIECNNDLGDKGFGRYKCPECLTILVYTVDGVSSPDKTEAEKLESFKTSGKVSTRFKLDSDPKPVREPIKSEAKSEPIGGLYTPIFYRKDEDGLYVAHKRYATREVPKSDLVQYLPCLSCNKEIDPVQGLYSKVLVGTFRKLIESIESVLNTVTEQFEDVKVTKEIELPIFKTGYVCSPCYEHVGLATWSNDKGEYSIIKPLFPDKGTSKESYSYNGRTKIHSVRNQDSTSKDIKPTRESDIRMVGRPWINRKTGENMGSFRLPKSSLLVDEKADPRHLTSVYGNRSGVIKDREHISYSNPTSDSKINKFWEEKRNRK